MESMSRLDLDFTLEKEIGNRLRISFDFTKENFMAVTL